MKAEYSITVNHKEYSLPHDCYCYFKKENKLERCRIRSKIKLEYVYIIVLLIKVNNSEHFRFYVYGDKNNPPERLQDEKTINDSNSNYEIFMDEESLGEKKILLEELNK